MTYTLYTLGYEQRNLADFVDILISEEIHVLLDVRETAWSHKPGFAKGALADAVRQVGIGYVHASFVGNPKWLRDVAPRHADCLAWYDWYLDEHEEIVESFDWLVTQLKNAKLQACLTCFERYAADCHRGILSARWFDNNPDCRIIHLAEGELGRRTSITEVTAARESLDTTFQLSQRYDAVTESSPYRA